jgi:NADH:ubiquinone oxidoreductase subunit K
MIGLTHYLVLGAFVFVCGLLTMMVKRNAIGILMGVELILNAANLNFVAFNRYLHAGDVAAGRPMLDGQVFAIFVIVLAAAEAAVALAIFLNYYNNFATIDVERGQNLKG